MTVDDIMAMIQAVPKWELHRASFRMNLRMSQELGLIYNTAGYPMLIKTEERFPDLLAGYPLEIDESFDRLQFGDFQKVTA